MKQTHAVGIDLGTTYSCISWLNEHGQPVTIPNQEGELATPSVVFFDGDEPIVGTEALRNAIAHPELVVQNAKRYIGNPDKFWKIGSNRYSPTHVSAMILRKLVGAAQEQIGEISEAVITVPAQFSDAQRHATIQAGHAAGLDKVEIINEPVAAALCHVLGNEGLAFTELAVDQRLLIFDLGGGTLDLAIVSYTSDQVQVIASDGDLELGGIDWTKVLIDAAAEKFIADFKEDPRRDPASHQFLALEAEQAKRSLSVRPRAAITVQHAGHRKTYQIEQEEFVALSRPLVKRSEGITRRILANKDFGWAHIDVVLTTGGSSRMPMIRNSLKKLSGRTLNSSLSPDQSIAHGAAYYAGMLLSNQQYTRTVFNSQASSRLSRLSQQSVNARALGILIRDTETGQRVPHYLIAPNSPLPVSRTHVFGTVADGQTRVHVRIVESGTDADHPPTTLGECLISDLPPNLPEGSKVEVSISYDHQARVHVSARELKSGQTAEVEIIRQENLNAQLQDYSADQRSAAYTPDLQQAPQKQPASTSPKTSRSPSAKTTGKPQRSQAAPQSSQPASPQTLEPQTPWSDELAAFADVPSQSLDDADLPIPLCNSCGTELSRHGTCPTCGTKPRRRKKVAATTSNKKPKRRRPDTPTAQKVAKGPDSDSTKTSRKRSPKENSPDNPEDEFWSLIDDF
jgi:molecular chaperone DnaK